MEVNIQQKINSEFKYEKIKKMLNNPFIKVSLGFVGIGTIGIAAKLIYDKLNNKNIESKKIKDEIKLDANDKKFIAKNFFLCGWGKGNYLCWNDVFTQLLMCPDIRCGNYKSEKIMKTINWINKNLGEKYNDDPLKRKIEVPSDVRPAPNGFESYLTDGKGHGLDPLLNCNWNGMSLDKLGVVNTTCMYDKPPRKKPYNKPYGFCSLSDMYSYASFSLSYLGDANNKKKNYIAKITIDKSENMLWNLSNCFQLSAKNYYPTYIIVHDDIYYTNPTHVFAYYVIYDENMKIKYFLKVDDLKQNMEIVPKDKVLKELNSYCHFWFVLSRGDIVKKYYVPK